MPRASPRTRQGIDPLFGERGRIGKGLSVETTHTLLYLILIIAAAKIGGEIAEYFRQPAVMGELLAGVLLGTTALRSAALDPAIVFVGAIGHRASPL